MALILCPECQTKISDKATSCPHCGYTSTDALLPISVQETYEPTPVFEYDIAEWTPSEALTIISPEDNKDLFRVFGNWEQIQVKLPAIADTIRALAAKETVMVAQMDSYVKKLIETGVYRFSIDKHGEILPTIRDASGIVKQVRLSEMQLTPQLSQSLNNLATQAAMAQILDKIECVSESIKQIHIELQNDRIALAESARDKLLQAMRIQDARLREIAILNVIGTATEAKRILMRNFAQNLAYISENSKKSLFELIFDFKGHEVEQKAIDTMQALVSITNVVQIECEGYAALGEFAASQACLTQFRSFITSNKLDRRDTLLLVNENLEKKQNSIVDDFSLISARIRTFEDSIASGKSPIALLTTAGGVNDET